MKNRSTTRRGRFAVALASVLIGLVPGVSFGQTTVIDTDFNDNPLLQLFGNAVLTNAKDGADGAGDNYISVTDNLNGQRGAIVFDDPTGGFPITAFTIRADLRVGGGTAAPADGFSFNLVRPTDPLIGTGDGYAASPTGEGNLPEEGSTTGLAIGFDEWFSGGSDTIGMSVRLDNVILQEIPLTTQNGAVDDPTSLQTGPLGPNGVDDDSLLEWAPIEIILDAGNLTINWKNSEVFSGNVNWTPGPGQIVLGGRTGGARANHHMDNLFVEVTGDEKINVSAVRSGIDFLEIDIDDVGTSILDPGTVNLLVDGNNVTAGLTINKAGNTTTIRHDQNPQFLFSTTISYELTAEDGIGQMLSREADFTTQDPDIVASNGLMFLQFDVTDVGASVLDPNTINVEIMVNGSPITNNLTISKNGATTTIRHDEVPQFPFGSLVEYSLTSMDNFLQNLNNSGSFTVVEPFFPFMEDLMGAEQMVAEGLWGVRYIFGAGTISDPPFMTAINLIKNAAADPGNFQGTIVDVQEEAMNHGSNVQLFQPDRPYHPDAVSQGCCGDDFILYGVGYMLITEAGDYTVGVHSDDGFGCRIQGFNFTSINAPDGNRMIDPVSSDTFAFLGNTGNSDTRAVASNVQPGVYRVEFFWWERGGGDHGEIYIAQGSFLNDGDTTIGSDPAQWKLIGGAPGGTFAVPGFNAAGVDVGALGPGLQEGIDFPQTAPNPNGGGDAGLTNLTEVANAIAQGTPVMSNHDAINFNDPGFGGPGRIPGDVPFPQDFAGTDDQDFLIEFSGTMVIPRAGTYNIGFQGDDGSFFRVIGQTFTSIVENATGNGVIDENGARIICDCLTGNSSTVGQITLAAGDYQVEGAFFERGGGAYVEVFGAEVGAPGTFLITRDGSRVENIQSQDGQPLVGGPSSAPFAITEFIRDDVLEELTITFNSLGSKDYAVDLTEDLAEGNWFEASDLSGDGLSTTAVVQYSIIRLNLGLQPNDPIPVDLFARVRDIEVQDDPNP